MKIHENKNLFLDAIIATSQKLDIEPIYVEKDYWISRSLKLLANADKDKRAIFCRKIEKGLAIHQTGIERF